MRSALNHLYSLAIVALLCAGIAWSQPSRDLERVPPPEGAYAEDVVSHTLAPEIGTWRRADLPSLGDVTALETLTSEDRELLATYQAQCGAVAQYEAPEGSGHARVLMIAFSDSLHALGFFASQRGERAKRVLLTSPAYRNEADTLHVWSLQYYLRVHVGGVETQALPPDQYLAARFEVRLPESEEQPRLLRVIPRGWVNALTVSYGPSELLDEDTRPMRLAVRRMMGASQMRVEVIQADAPTQAAHYYTLLLERVLRNGRALELRDLGEEAFVTRNGAATMAMLEDEFLVHISGDASSDDTEAVLRLVGTLVRISPPLPEVRQGAETLSSG